MTNATLTKATDTPKARKAVVTPKPNTAVTVTVTTPTATAPLPTKAAIKRVDTAAYVAAVKSDTKSVATKARIIGRAINGGSDNKSITADLTAALESADMIVPKSLSAAVTHYATGYAAASAVKLSSHDGALHAAYQISTGEVRAADREAFVAGFGTGSPEAFISGCRDLIKAARAAKKGTPAASDAETETETEAESISPVAEFAALMRQASKMLDLAAENDDDADYCTMLDAATEFASKYVAL